MALSTSLRRTSLSILVILMLAFVFPPALAATITVKTDAPSYFASQTITTSGTVSPTPGPNNAVIVTIRNPSNTVVDIGPAQVDSSTGTYSFVTVAGGSTSWIAGTYSVNATWGGSGGTATTTTTFQYSPTPPIATTTTTVACTSPIVVAATSTCTATLAGTQGTVTGETVTFSVQSGGSGAVTLPSPPGCGLSAAGTCPITVTGATAGSVTIKASYPGDANNAASSGTGTLTVTGGATTTTVSCLPASVAIGAASTCTATITGTSGAVAGTAVTFSQASGSTGRVTFPSPATCALAAGGTCSIAATGAAAGSVTVSASYPGDSSNGPSSGSATLAVQAATTTTTTSTTSSTTASTSSLTTVTVTQTSPTTTSTTSQSAGGGLSANVVYIIAAVALVAVLLGAVFVWRRKVASDYEQRSARSP
jgi:hypothetical protein